MCRAGSSLAAHMLGYTRKTLVWWEIGEKGPYSPFFQSGVMPVPAGFLWLQK